jgi:hypothetical protein
MSACIPMHLLAMQQYSSQGTMAFYETIQAIIKVTRFEHILIQSTDFISPILNLNLMI